jgi:hypothetical protein
MSGGGLDGHHGRGPSNEAVNISMTRTETMDILIHGTLAGHLTPKRTIIGRCCLSLFLV